MFFKSQILETRILQKKVPIENRNEGKFYNFEKIKESVDYLC
jgi:hypothetical protein